MVNFYELNTVENSRLVYAVIVTRYKEKWVFVRNKERITWELPAGHREEGEEIISAAARELVEETGATVFNITPVCIYSVDADDTEIYGQLFYAEILDIGKLPDLEIAEIKFLDAMSENLTYPEIQPVLFKKAEEFYRQI
ncbi:MAG: NUDIX domain-containing protein [Clostridiaceae bacterium]